MALCKRTLSFLLMVSLFLSLLTSIPVRAASETKTFERDGYTVTYRINSQWDSSQTVTVTLTNTGTAPILNWAVRYDSAGEIKELSNAAIYRHSGSTYLLKNVGYNSEIKPKQSVNFNYTVTGGLSVPEEITLVSKKVEKQEGFAVQYQITDDWGTGFQAAVTISNHTDAPIEAWKLSFDSNFTVQSVWEAALVEKKDRTYTIGCPSWSASIPANASLQFGFTGSKEASVKPELTNFKLTEVVIEEEIHWDDPTDSDKDGLPDVYELNAYHTDPHNPDTDGDGLPDGYEVMTLRTEPALADSDGNGTTDEKEDFDADGLSNYEEYQLGTDPYRADTDEDEVSDGEEVNRYKTDPLKPDTDDDNVLDGDELLLELDPNDPETTDGIPDADAIRKQTLPAKDLDINEYNEAFKISIEVNAGNYVKRYLEQEVSPYAGVLSDNRAIVGQPVFLNYEAGAVSGGTITFQMEPDFIRKQPQYYPELQLGMERYGIFCYDEEVGTLVPVACDYDEANSCIRTDFSNAGDLVVMDYEALLYDLGLEAPAAFAASVSAMGVEASPESVTIAESPAPEENANESVQPVDDLTLEEIEHILNSADTPANAIDLSSEEAKTVKQVDLVLVVDSTGSMGSYISNVKANIAALISRLRSDGISLYVSVIDYKDITCDGRDSTKVNNRSGVDFYSSMGEISSILNSIRVDGGGDGPETVLDGLGYADRLSYRQSAAKFVFVITDANYKNDNIFGIRDIKEVAESLKSKGICTSVITDVPYYATLYSPLTEATNGSLLSIYGNFCDAMYEVIYRSAPKDTFLLANNLVSGSLRETLTYGGVCDTDGDGLTDSQEVNWDYIKRQADGSYTLPLWGELCQTSRVYGGSQVNPLFTLLSGTSVVPALSNPLSKDSDNDYYPDLVDKDKLKANPMYINDKALDDTNFHNGQTIREHKSDEYTDGKFVTDQKNGTGKYVFSRKPTATYQFVLTPKKEGFYRFSGGLNMDVKYTKGALFWKQTIKVKPEPDGTYLLKKNVKYTITMRCVKSADTNFTARQDNWVYAPNGGLWTIEDIGNPMTVDPLNSSLFISPKLLVESTCKVLPDNEKYGVYTCYTKDDIDNIMANLTYSDPETEANFKEIVNNCSATGSMIIVVVTFVPGLREYTLVSYIATYGGGLLTSAGFISWIADQLQKQVDARIKKVIKDGNLSIRCSHFTGKLNNWDVWETPAYVNKYQLGNRGKVKTNITANDVKNYCGW